MTQHCKGEVIGGHIDQTTSETIWREDQEQFVQKLISGLQGLEKRNKNAELLTHTIVRKPFTALDTVGNY